MSGPLRVERYQPSMKPEWDAFVSRSKNGVFLFMRDYMDYHADRFQDHSLVVRDEAGTVLALLPANQKDSDWISHGGLTYGGFVTDERMGAATMLALFDALPPYARSAGLRRLIYKPIPAIYHRLPAEEDLYALVRHGARLCQRDVSSAIRATSPLKYAKGRRCCVKKGLQSGLRPAPSQDYETFMAIEEAHLLSRHGVRPVHTAAEMRLLAGRFPNHIALYTIGEGPDMLGGVVIYATPQVAHAQYIAATAAGKERCALDVLMDHLIRERYADRPFFDFGRSTTQAGRCLDLGLIGNKESFGGRSIVYDCYEWTLDPSAEKESPCP